jgi:hypothetical protein
MDIEDRKDRPWGLYAIEAETSEEALDIFHEKIAIACLDHFEINVRRYRGGSLLQTAREL